VAKILVADDNSNVQKTVALALADLGVEVIGVNNGEAAVRKLGDISPDLILADIFMPVRNGYEVCEFVKRDSRFTNIPVVLLVGAFDPLDEREAQRVNADGILKKPFVPPDPLIAMVKTLLDRTLGDRLVAVGASKPAVAAQNKSGGVAIAEKPSPAPEVAEEVPLQEFHPPVDRLSFGEGDAPVAFQQLLETPAAPTASEPGTIDPVDDDQILTSSRPASLGDPIFWRTESPKDESDEQNDEERSEADEESDISLDLPMRAWTPDSEALSRAASEAPQPADSFELVRDETEEEAGKPPTIAEPASLIVHDPASQSALNVESGKPEDLAANPIEWMASVPPPVEEPNPEATLDWPAASMGASSNQKLDAAQSGELKNDAASATSEPAHKVTVPAMNSGSKSEPPPFPTPAQPPLKPMPQGLEDKALSSSEHDWADLATNAEAESFESAAVIAKSSRVPVTPPATSTDVHLEDAHANPAPSASKPLSQNVNDTARSMPRQDWADLSASLQPQSGDAPAEKTVALTAKHPETASSNSAQPPSKPGTQKSGDTLPSISKQELDEMAASAQHKTNEPTAQKPKTSPVPVGQSPAKSSLQSPEDTARSVPKHDWADLAASVPAKSTEPVVVKPKSAATSPVQTSGMLASNSQNAAASSTQTPTTAAGNAQPEPANSATPGSPDPALVEAVVQRVLEKMRPQVVDIITKEFLRPVVQALVHREITKR
jgi:CheY-like chemotaxis protein